MWPEKEKIDLDAEYEQMQREPFAPSGKDSVVAIAAGVFLIALCIVVFVLDSVITYEKTKIGQGLVENASER